MAETKKIKTALVSVFHKDGLDELLKKLHAEGVKLLSTGGTQKFIESLGLPCQKVEDVTTYPSILGGRVKTLHPKIFGGILGRRELAEDQAQMKQYDVKISHAALSDMEQIYSYIADRLLEPDTAMGQYNRIAEAIQSLNILPERCALVESEPERTQGLRQMLVDNYSVFYIVGEDTVSVARVLYSASDLVRRLRRMK